jgi:hypothetical protein
MNETVKLEIRKATRQGIVPLIGISGKSATGKTKSALLLMRGIVGANKRMVCIDTEFRRSEEYADEIPGGFSVIQLDAPYSPRRYHEALELAVQNADGVVVDSISHEWTGENGVLMSIDDWLTEKCGDDYQKRDRFKMMAWNSQAPREHAVLVSYLARYPVPLILCFRAKDKIHIDKGDKPGEKTKVTTEQDVPVQRGDLVWEMKLVLETNKLEENGADMGGGYFTVKKRGIDSLCSAVCAVGKRLSVAHGEVIARWCNAPSGVSTAQPTVPAPTPSKPKNSLLLAKKRLWDMTAVMHEGNKDKLVEWLKFANLYTKPMGELTEPELNELITKAAPLLPKETQQ